jgi:hypothetical protein
MFTASASLTIRVSFPVPAKYGGWTTCVKTTAQGINGRSLGAQTYLVNIKHDEIGSREHVDDHHWCAKENVLGTVIGPFQISTMRNHGAEWP